MAEPDSPRKAPHHGPVPEELLAFGSLPQLTLRQAVAGLFLFPHLVLISARRTISVRRPLLLFLAAWLLCALFMTATLAPNALTQAGEFSHWLGKEMGELRRTEAGLAWTRPEDAPQTVRFRGFRVDFVAGSEEMVLADLVKGKDDWGLWFTPTKVVFWTVRFGGTAKPILDVASDRPSLNWREILPPGSTLTTPQFVRGARSFARWLVPMAIFLAHALSTLMVCCLFLALFTLLPALLRGPSAIGGIRAALSVNLYCSVVPLIVATAYSRVAPQTLNFVTVFVFAFLGYLIWAFSRVRRFLGGV